MSSKNKKVIKFTEKQPSSQKEEVKKGGRVGDSNDIYFKINEYWKIHEPYESELSKLVKEYIKNYESLYCKWSLLACDSGTAILDSSVQIDYLIA